VTATLLVQPYMIYYDLAWLVLPIAYLCVDRIRQGPWMLGESVVIACTWVLPMQGYLAVMKPAMGQWAVVVLPLLLVTVCRRAGLRRLISPYWASFRGEGGKK
jgi:hypothetical protein